MLEMQVHAEPHVVTVSDLRRLLEPTQGPCVSIYCATAPAANADQGRIRFKTAVREVEHALRRNQEPGQEESLLEPLRQLEDNDSFWLSQTHGLAVFLCPQRLHVLNLIDDVDDLTVVADSFHVRPLIRMIQPRARYQVLCVSNERVKLYEGDPQRLVEVPLHSKVPQSMGEALGEPSRVTNPKDGVFVPDDSDTRNRQLGRYFRRLDQAIWEHHSRDSGLPLILAALPEYQGVFREASHNPLLVEQGIRRDAFKDVDARKLRTLAWEAVEPVWHQRINELGERFDLAAAHDHGLTNVNEVARRAVFGQVETLLIRDGQHIGGNIHPETGEVNYQPMADPKVDDVLDDLAEIVLRRGGDVLMLTAPQMPTSAGDAPVAAILRKGAG